MIFEFIINLTMYLLMPYYSKNERKKLTVANQKSNYIGTSSTIQYISGIS